VVYDYAKQDEYCEISLDGPTFVGDLPVKVLYFKDVNYANNEFLLIGSNKGNVYVYNLISK